MMAGTREQLIGAIRAAHEAGQTEEAQRLADMLKALPAQAPAPAPAPAPQGESFLNAVKRGGRNALKAIMEAGALPGRAEAFQSPEEQAVMTAGPRERQNAAELLANNSEGKPMSEGQAIEAALSNERMQKLDRKMPTVEPSTLAMRGVSGATQGALTALLSGGPSAMGALSGAVGGGTSEAMVAGGNNPWLATAAGVLAGGGIAAGSSAVKRAASGMNNRAAGEIERSLAAHSPEARAEALQRMKDARAKGVDLTLPQALSERSPSLDSAMQNALRYSKAEQKLLPVFNRQDSQGLGLLEQELRTMPKATDPVSAIDAMVKGAQGFQKSRTRMRSDVVRDAYAQDASVTPNDVKLELGALVPDLMALQAKAGETTEAGKAIGRMITQLSRTQHPTVDNVTTMLNETAQKAFKNVQGMTGVKAKTTADIGKATQLIEDALQRMQKDRATGDAMYRSITEGAVAPTKRGFAQEIAQRGGNPMATPAQRVATTLPAYAESAFTPGQVRADLAGIARNAEPQTTAKFTREALADAAQQAFKTDDKGYMPADALSRLVTKFYGAPGDAVTKEKAQLLLKQTARDIGADPEKYAKGWDTTLETIRALGRNRDKMLRVGSEVNSMEGLPRLLGGSLARSTQQANMAMEALNSRKWSAFADMVQNTPQGIKAIEQLSSLKPGSPQAQKAIAQLLAATPSGEGDLKGTE